MNIQLAISLKELLLIRESEARGDDRWQSSSQKVEVEAWINNKIIQIFFMFPHSNSCEHYGVKSMAHRVDEL